LQPIDLQAQKKKFLGKSIKNDQNINLQSIDGDYQFNFPNINLIPYYSNPQQLAIIESLWSKKNYAQVLPYLEKYVSQFGISNFQTETHLMWKLAQAYEVSNQPKKAKAMYKLVLKHHLGRDRKKIAVHFDTLSNEDNIKYVPLDYYYELVEYRKAVDTLTPPKSVYLNMGEMVNDPKYPDYGPTMDVNGKRLIYTKRRKELTANKLAFRENEDLFVSINYDGFWDESKPFERVINTGCNEGSACISRDGMTLYFTRCKVLDYQFECENVMGSCDIFVSKLNVDGEDSTWSEAENLGPNINTHSWDSHPTLSHSEDTLFFASDRLGGFGMSDLYYSVFDKSKNKWLPAKNLGPVINTRGNETSPFYHPTHDVLYFSSNGQLNNFGNLDSSQYIYKTFDIYKSRIIRNTFEEPKNIGPLVNNKGDEMYFTIDYESKDLFYSKTEEEGSKNHELFSFPLPMEAQPEAYTKLTGSLKDSITGEPFKGIVSIIDLTNGIEVAPKYIRDDGSYEFDLIKNNDYLLVLQGDDFLRIEEKLHLNSDTSINQTTPSIKYNKWKFQTLEFEGNKAEIKPEMQTDLDKVLDFLLAHPTFNLKISGHTDSDGDENFNLKLSEKRAEAIKNYLVKKGNLDKSRIEAKGFGSSKRIIQNEETEEDKHLNRRVEFEIIR
jgi:outer membrane protein OmpA-like peptidoglycan-associated protein